MASIAYLRLGPARIDALVRILRCRQVRKKFVEVSTCMSQTDELIEPTTHSINDYVVYAIGCFVLNCVAFAFVGLVDSFAIFRQPIWFILVFCLPASFNIVLWATYRSKRKCSRIGMLLFALLTGAFGYFNAKFIEGIGASI